jgi:hypothetical protein
LIAGDKTIARSSPYPGELEIIAEPMRPDGDWADPARGVEVAMGSSAR